MIYGNINSPAFEDQAAVLPPLLGAVLHFLKDTDLETHEPGVFDLELLGEKLILQVLDLKTSPREALRPEIPAARNGQALMRSDAKSAL